MQYRFTQTILHSLMITKARKRCSKDKIVVLKSQILSENFLDLLTDDDRTFMEDFAKELETKIKEKEAEIGKWKHQEGFILDALYKIDPFDLVRAAYHVPRKHTYFRCDYETVQIQLCVKQTECIQVESIEEVEGHAQQRI